jgi:hypothetical protein
MLDRLAMAIFSTSISTQRFKFISIEECVQATAKKIAVNYSLEFDNHPGPMGHKLYADCLVHDIHKTMGLPQRTDVP